MGLFSAGPWRYKQDQQIFNFLHTCTRRNVVPLKIIRNCFHRILLCTPPYEHVVDFFLDLIEKQVIWTLTLFKTIIYFSDSCLLCVVVSRTAFVGFNFDQVKINIRVNFKSSSSMLKSLSERTRSF